MVVFNRVANISLNTNLSLLYVSKFVLNIVIKIVFYLGRVDGEGEVFVLLEEGQLAAEVDHARVDRVRNCKVDQFAEKKWNIITTYSI